MLRLAFAFFLLTTPLFAEIVDIPLEKPKWENKVIEVVKLEDVNLFWHRDGTVEIKRNREFLLVVKSEPSGSNNVLAYLACKIEVLNDIMMVYRGDLLLNKLKIYKVIYARDN